MISVSCVIIDRSQTTSYLNGVFGIAASEVSDDFPWCQTGYESGSRSSKRITDLISWIDDCRNTLPDDHVMVLVAHGELIERVVNRLLHLSFASSSIKSDRMSFTGIRNTSVTSLHLPSKSYAYGGSRPSDAGEVNKYHTLLEFFNDTSHLGNEQLIAYASTALQSRL